MSVYLIFVRYLAEVAPPKLRMSLCTVFEVMTKLCLFNFDIWLQICFVAGVVFGVAVGLPYEFESFDIGYPWWRVMFLICAIPAFLQVSRYLPFSLNSSDFRSYLNSFH